MHLPDGLLNPAASLSTGVIAAGALAYAARRVGDELPRHKRWMAAAVAASVFAAQMVNVPVSGGASGHLLGGVLAAVILGPWTALLMMASVLLVQCCLFGDGGIAALGANILNMGVVGCLFGAAITHTRLGGYRGAWIAGSGLAAGAAVLAGAALAALELAYGSHTPVGSLLATMLGAHVFAAVGEAMVTMVAVSVLWELRPVMAAGSVRPNGAIADGSARGALGRYGGWGTSNSGWAALCGGLVVVMLAAGAAPLASTLPDGLEWSLARLDISTDSIAAALPAPMAEYSVHGLGSWAGTATTGILGALAACAVSWMALRVAGKRAVSAAA